MTLIKSFNMFSTRDLDVLCPFLQAFVINNCTAHLMYFKNAILSKTLNDHSRSVTQQCFLILLPMLIITKIVFVTFHGPNFAVYIIKITKY